MSDDVFSEHKLADAVPQPLPVTNAPPTGGKPTPNHTNVAEQQREQAENEQAHHDQGDLKARLIEEGKAAHMGGHSKGRS